MTLVRRLDHVAVAVRDTEKALEYFRDHLGLSVESTEELGNPRVRLTYLDAGNVFIQLVEPLDPSVPVAQFLEHHGEGIHHICFGVDDVEASAAALARPSPPDVTLGAGRGRISAFVPGSPEHGVQVECTEFRYDEDVERRSGWIPQDRSAEPAAGRRG